MSDLTAISVRFQLHFNAFKFSIGSIIFGRVVEEIIVVGGISGLLQGKSDIGGC